MEDKLAILQIIRGLDIGGDSGGAERFGVELGRTLNQLGHAVTVCAFFRVGSPAEEQWADKLRSEGIRVFFCVDYGGTNNLGRYVQGLRVLLREMRGKPMDGIHSHFQLGSLTALLLRLSGRARIAVRTAHIRHEWELGKNGWLLHNLFVRRLFPMILDQEVGVSQAIVDYLAAHPGVKTSGHQPVLIHNAVSFEEKADLSLAPELLERPTDTLLVGSVGRLTEQKGYVYLLDAAPMILERFPQTQFVLAGDGDLRGEHEEHIRRLGLGGRVRLLGLRSDVPYLLPQWDVFVLPSLWEGFPTVLLESMVSGTPVIATDIPGTRELVQDGQNGLLVPPRDPQALAEAICRLLGDPAVRQKLAGQASQDVKRYFIRNIGLKYQELYRGLLARRK